MLQVLLGLANLAELAPEISVLQGTQQRAVHGPGVAVGGESSVIAPQAGFDRLMACGNQQFALAQHAQKHALAAGLPMTLQGHDNDPTRQQCFKFSFSNIPVYHGMGVIRSINLLVRGGDDAEWHIDIARRPQ